MVFACRSNFRNTIFWHCFFNHVMCSLVYFSIFLICSSALCSCWLLFTCDKAEILLVLCCNLPDINLFVFLLGFCRWCGHFGQGILLNGVCLDFWRLLCLKDKLLLWKKKKIPIFTSQVSSRPDDLSSRHPRLLVQLPEVQKDD